MTQRRTPSEVITQLRKHPGEVYRIRESASQRLTGTWNPSKPYGSGNLYGYGTGSYWLEGDQVHLEWHPKKGPIEHYFGSVPTGADSQSPNRLRVRRAMRTAIAIYLLSAAAGFVLGYAFTSGASTHRATIGLFGLIGGYFAAYVVMVTAIGVIRVRRGRQLSRQSVE